MFCQKQIIGKEIYEVCYISSSYSVFFSRSTEGNKKHSCMCGGLTVAGCPPGSLPTLHPQQVRGENKIKKLMGQDKEREFTYYLPSRAKQTRLGEC